MDIKSTVRVIYLIDFQYQIRHLQVRSNLSPHYTGRLKKSLKKSSLLFVAICGAAILYGLIPQESIGSLGVIAPPNNVTTWQAFGLEIVLTYMMMFGVFAATDPDRNFPGYGMPLAIGICVFICLLVGVRNHHHQITEIYAYAHCGWSKSYW